MYSSLNLDRWCEQEDGVRSYVSGYELVATLDRCAKGKLSRENILRKKTTRNAQNIFPRNLLRPIGITPGILSRRTTPRRSFSRMQSLAR